MDLCMTERNEMIEKLEAINKKYRYRIADLEDEIDNFKHVNKIIGYIENFNYLKELYEIRDSLKEMVNSSHDEKESYDVRNRLLLNLRAVIKDIQEVNCQLP